MKQPWNIRLCIYLLFFRLKKPFLPFACSGAAELDWVVSPAEVTGSRCDNHLFMSSWKWGGIFGLFFVTFGVLLYPTTFELLLSKLVSLAYQNRTREHFQHLRLSQRPKPPGHGDLHRLWPVAGIQHPTATSYSAHVPSSCTRQPRLRDNPSGPQAALRGILRPRPEKIVFVICYLLLVI